MITKRSISLLIIVGTLGAILAVPWSTSAHDWSPYSPCNIAGTWLGNFPATGSSSVPLRVTETLTPIDPAGNRLAYVMRMLNSDITFSGMFPETNSVSDLVGEAARTGPDTYELTVIGYGINNPALDGVIGTDRGQVQYIWVLSGLAQCIDDNVVEHDLQLSLYSAIDNPDFAFPWAPGEPVPLHDQDVDGDLFPDAGEAPIFSVPFSHVSKRVSHPMLP